MEAHTRADTVAIYEAVSANDETIVQVVTYREGVAGHRWIATFNKDALGEHSAYFQARRLATAIADGKRLAIVDNTKAKAS